MISHRLRRLLGCRQGFTLIEIVLAMAIMGLIGAGVSTAAIQILKQGGRNGTYVTASQSTMNALHWVSRDAEMSQTVVTGGATGFPVTLSWTDWDNSAYQVVYTIEDGRLVRNYSVNGAEPGRTIVSEYVNTTSENTTCEFAERVLTLRITSTVGEGARAISVTDTRQIFIRSSP